jgi:hypothetical protein
MADLLTDHLYIGVGLRITAFAEEQLAEEGVQGFLCAFFHWATDVVLSLETAEVDFEHIEHSSFW